jgi:hypothetical protein
VGAGSGWKGLRLKPNSRTDLVTGLDEIQTTDSRLGNDLDSTSPKMTESDWILGDRFCCGRCRRPLVLFGRASGTSRPATGGIYD